MGFDVESKWRWYYFLQENPQENSNTVHDKTGLYKGREIENL